MTASKPWLMVILIACSGCVSIERPIGERAAQPDFNPRTFFVGRTQGMGVLKVALRRAGTTVVEGDGLPTADGGIVLHQTVRREGHPPFSRSWTLYPEGAGRWRGTLTDAAGPVDGRVDGNRLHLHFRMKGGLVADQWLLLQPGGTTATNVMLVSKFGIPLARLDETITRVVR